MYITDPDQTITPAQPIDITQMSKEQAYTAYIKNMTPHKCEHHAPRFTSYVLAHCICPYCSFSIVESCYGMIQQCSTLIGFSDVLNHAKIQPPQDLFMGQDSIVELRDFAVNCYKEIMATATSKLHHFFLNQNPTFAGFIHHSTEPMEIPDPTMVIGSTCIPLSSLYPLEDDLKSDFEEKYSQAVPIGYYKHKVDEIYLNPLRLENPVFCHSHPKIKASLKGELFPCPACFIEKQYNKWATSFYTLASLRSPKIKPKHGTDECFQQADDFNMNLKEAIRNEWIEKAKVQFIVYLFSKEFPYFATLFDWSLPPTPQTIKQLEK